MCTSRMLAEKIGLTLLLLSPLPAQSPAQRLAERSVAPVIWAIGEGFRVDPITGRVREEMRIDQNPGEF